MSRGDLFGTGIAKIPIEKAGYGLCNYRWSKGL